MYFAYAPEKIELLVIMCFSFYIFIFSLTSKYGNCLLKLMGVSFIIPLFLSASSFFVKNMIQAEALIKFSGTSLAIAFLILLLLKQGEKYHKAIKYSIIIMPPALYLLIGHYSNLPSLIALKPYNLILFSVLCIVNIILFIKRIQNSKLLIWSTAVLPIPAIMAYYLTSQTSAYISSFLLFLVYLLFSLYFSKQLVHELLEKASDADKKLSAYHRSMELEVKKRTFEIEQVNRRLVDISRTDALSKAYNRAAIYDIIDKLIQSKSREFSILMFDIDDFKIINDTLGHITGDTCIKKLSITAKSCIRDMDYLGRYGGDEFIVVLPDISTTQARYVADRLRKEVENTSSPHYTVSIGIAAYPHDGITTKELISAADEALYISKDTGKNRISSR